MKTLQESLNRLNEETLFGSLTSIQLFEKDIDKHLSLLSEAKKIIPKFKAFLDKEFNDDFDYLSYDVSVKLNDISIYLYYSFSKENKILHKDDKEFKNKRTKLIEEFVKSINSKYKIRGYATNIGDYFTLDIKI